MNTIEWIIKQINIAKCNISKETTDSDLYQSDYNNAMKLLNKVKEEMIEDRKQYLINNILLISHYYNRVDLEQKTIEQLEAIDSACLS